MKKINRYPMLIPMPVALVGGLVNNRPNFLPIAHITPSGYQIPRFVVSSAKIHYTNAGIIENETFSVNIPTEEMVTLTDYFGIVSGNEVDKSASVEVFYSEKLKSAPMIKSAAVTHACKLVKTIDFGDTHYLFIGEVVETYVNEKYVLDKAVDKKYAPDKIPDIEKIKPFTFFLNHYWKMGEKLAQARSVGRSFKKD